MRQCKAGNGERGTGRGGTARALAGILALAALLTWPSVAAAAEVKELLANGSFELLDAEGGPESWGIRDWGDTKHATTKVVGKGRLGKQCLQLRGTSGPILYAAFSHPVDLGETAPARLLLTLYYHTDGNPAPDLSVVTFAEDFTVAEWQTPALAADAIALEPSSRWRSLTWHVRLLPSARQAIVVVRIHGSGSLFVDGASLKVHPAEVACEVLAPGLVVQTKGARQCRLRLTNRTGEALPVRVQLEAIGAKRRKAEAGASASLAPDRPEELTLNYSCPLDNPAPVTITVSDPKREVIYEQVTAVAPGLIDGRIVSPAFRGTILSGLPLAEISARGSVNATPELRRELTLQARLVGLGLDLPPVPVDEEGYWRVSTPLEGMLTGGYSLQITAVQNARTVAELNLPLLKPEPKPSEAAYDERMRLWLGERMRLPLGVFFAVDEADFKAVAEAGFNTLVLPSRLASTTALATAQKLGLAVLISSASTDQDFWKGLHGRLIEQQDLAGWYVLQRPDALAPPAPVALMASIYAGVRRIDPRHPVCLAVGALSRLADYAPCCDILMPWTEPEPVGDIRSVDALLSHAVEACAGEKPVWPLIQMTGAAYASDARLDPQGNGRPPTPAEYRCMAYLCLARGANGLFSYAYRIPQARNQREFFIPADAPELWKTVRQVNQELRALTPVLLEGEPVAVQADDPAMALRGYRYQDAFYVLAANPLARPATFSFRVPGMKTNQLEVAFDTRKVCGAAAGQFADQLEPLGVRVYMGR